jgi:hypothetical protein
MEKLQAGIYMMDKDMKVWFICKGMPQLPGMNIAREMEEDLKSMKQEMSGFNSLLTTQYLQKFGKYKSYTMQLVLSCRDPATSEKYILYQKGSRYNHAYSPEVHLKQYLAQDDQMRGAVVSGMWQRMVLLIISIDGCNLESAIDITRELLYSDSPYKWCLDWLNLNFSTSQRYRASLLLVMGQWVRGEQLRDHDGGALRVLSALISTAWELVQASAIPKQVKISPSDQGWCWLMVMKHAEVYRTDEILSESGGKGNGLVLPIEVMLFAAGTFAATVFRDHFVLYGAHFSLITPMASEFKDWHAVSSAELTHTLTLLRETPREIKASVDTTTVTKRFERLVARSVEQRVYATLGWLDDYIWCPLQDLRVEEPTGTKRLKRIFNDVPFSISLGLDLPSIVNASGTLEFSQRYAWQDTPSTASFEYQIVTALHRSPMIMVDTRTQTAHYMSKLRCGLILAMREIEGLKQWQDFINLDWSSPVEESRASSALIELLRTRDRQAEEAAELSSASNNAQIAGKLSAHLALCFVRLSHLGQMFERSHNRIKGFDFDDVSSHNTRCNAISLPLTKARRWASLIGSGALPCIFASFTCEAIKRQTPDAAYRVTGHYWMTAFYEDICEHREARINERRADTAKFPAQMRATIVRADMYLSKLREGQSVWDKVQSHIHESAKITRIFSAIRTMLPIKKECAIEVNPGGLTVFS